MNTIQAATYRERLLAVMRARQDEVFARLHSEGTADTWLTENSPRSCMKNVKIGMSMKKQF